MGLNQSKGLVVNLYQNETMNLLVGALLLNPRYRISEGAKVNAISRLGSILFGCITHAVLEWILLTLPWMYGYLPWMYGYLGVVLIKDLIDLWSIKSVLCWCSYCLK